jgi:hypothetical protein
MIEMSQSKAYRRPDIWLAPFVTSSSKSEGAADRVCVDRNALTDASRTPSKARRIVPRERGRSATRSRRHPARLPLPSAPYLRFGFDACGYGAAQARTSEPAVAVRNFGEILLVVLFSKIEWWGIQDLGCDWPIAVRR